MSPKWSAAEFASLRHLYQQKFIVMMDAALHSVDQVWESFVDTDEALFYLDVLATYLAVNCCKGFLTDSFFPDRV